MSALIELVESPSWFIDEFGLKKTRYVFILLKHYFVKCREEPTLDARIRQACFEAEQMCKHWLEDVLIQTEETPKTIRDTRFVDNLLRAAFEF
jgi:hypothetical protein